MITPLEAAEAVIQSKSRRLVKSLDECQRLLDFQRLVVLPSLVLILVLVLL